jgi:hypothetical protein
VPLAEGVPPLPPSIEPASLVKALGLIQEVETKAKEVIKKRLEAKK